MLIPILAHTSTSYEEAIFSLLGKGRQHARILYQHWIRKGALPQDHPHFRNAEKLLNEIVSATDFSHVSLLRKKEENQTEKFLLQTKDLFEIETVALPMRAGYTLCLSSQVGCRMGCAFCETGKMGLLRSLTVEEIVSQFFVAKHGLKIDVRNLVFMGMGEPLDNYENVMKAIQIFTDMNGFGLGKSHITISTSGIVDKIYRLMDEADPALNLAVSVNAPNDEMRNKLMPINRLYQMEDLKKAMEAYTSHPRRKIFIEYVLIKNKTDSLSAAIELAAYLGGLNVTVNLIPYNPQTKGCFEAPDVETINLFANKMRELGFLTFIRGTKGQKIMAACGQLGNRKLKKSLVFSP